MVRTRLEAIPVYGAAAVVSLAAGFSIAHRLHVATFFALVVGLGLVAGARAHPRLALVAAISVMALPYTWAPVVPKLGQGFGILAGLFLLVVFLPALNGFRVTALDVAVIAFAVTAAPVSFIEGQPFHITQWFAPAITFPYLGFRVLFHVTDSRRVFAPVLVAVGVIVSVLGVWESVSGHNPLVTAAPPISGHGQAAATWNVPLHRVGHLRAASTFAHPIAFGMFLLIPLAFALMRPGRRYLAAAIVMLAGEVVTYSRGPWIGVLVIVLLIGAWSRNRIALIASAALAMPFFVGPVQRVIFQSGRSGTEAGGTVDYRFGLLDQAIHHISLLGHPDIDLAVAIPNFPDVTSLLAATILQTGVVGLLELALIAWLAVWALIHARKTPDHDYRAATAALVASLVGLLTVDLITNYQFFFWALVAYVAAGTATVTSGSAVRAEATRSDLFPS